ncbi:hypothetical protein [Pseudomonas sp. LT1P18]|uniref:hypothetical protein n=1 Tax=Pseudomonas arabinosi TaxID=3398357 RepID=UPI0039EF2562
METLHKNAAQATKLQNITGEFNAIFPNAVTPANAPYSRAPYRSQSLHNLAHLDEEFIDIKSVSGGRPVQSLFTGDLRELSLKIKKGTTSGTYKYKPGVDGAILDVRYGEMGFSEVTNNYVLLQERAIEATLILQVSEDERYYSSNSFDIKVLTSNGITLDIKADFKVYLTIE